MDILTLGSREDWRVFRLGQVFRERKEKGSDKEFPPLSVTMKGIVPQLESAAKSDDGDNRKIVRVGDYVINSRSDRKGSGGISKYEGSVSLISIVLEPIGIAPRFAHFLLRSSAFQEEFYRWGHGIVADLWTTRYADMKNIRLRLPDLSTQCQIADFLDRETTRIDSLIEKKKRLSSLLEEKLSAEIENLVSGQFVSPNFRISNDRTGNHHMPSGWVRLRLRRLFSSVDYGISTATQPSGRYKVLGMGHIQNGTVLTGDTGYVDEVDSSLLLRKGDLLFNRTNSRSLVGKVGLYQDDEKFLTFASYLVRIRPSRLTTSKYLNFLLNSKGVLERARALAIPSISQSNLNPTKYGTLEVALPPPDVQERIVEKLTRKLALIQHVQNPLRDSISKLADFRVSIVTAAVTGQIDVQAYHKRGETDRTLDRIEAEMSS